MWLLENSVSATKCVTPSGPAAIVELFEQLRPDPVCLVVVGHDEGDLRVCAVGEALETSHGDDLRIDGGDEGDPRAAIDMGEVLDFAG